MARSSEKKHRGVYEHPPGSEVWWIHYYAEGRRHREKVGGKQAAINRYQQRQVEKREGRLPQPQRHVPFDAFAREYLETARARLRSFPILPNIWAALDQVLRRSAVALDSTASATSRSA